jgi:hypothetical protein
MSNPDYTDYAEERDHPTREEEEGDAWEYWHQRAIKFEAALHQIKTVCRDNAAISDRGKGMALSFVWQVAEAAITTGDRTDG